MWIWINCLRIRIYKIWWMRIRIQNNKITKLISNNLLKSRKKYIFKSVFKPYRLATFLGSDLKNIISYEKNPHFFLLKLCFSFHLTPLDPERIHRPKKNTNPTGSKSLEINNYQKIRAIKKKIGTESDPQEKHRSDTSTGCPKRVKCDVFLKKFYTGSK